MWKCSLCLSILLMSQSIFAEGLVDPDRYRALTSDRRALHLGDVLTVLVVESTSAESAAGTGASSKTDFTFKGSTLKARGQLGLGLQGDTSGEGQTSRRGQVRSTVSVRVVDQLADGLLRVQGEQVVTINDDHQKIRITGLVRPDDVSYENTIYSYRLADAQIEIIGKGIVNDAQKQNIIYRFFKWIRLL